MKFKNTLLKIRNKFLFFKQCMHRTNTYLTLINAGMILFLFLNTLKEKGVINFDLDKYFVPILITGIMFLFLIGWVDIRFFKGIQEESKISFSLQPPFVDMRNKINEIHKEVIEEAVK